MSVASSELFVIQMSTVSSLSSLIAGLSRVFFLYTTCLFFLCKFFLIRATCVKIFLIRATFRID